MCFVAVDVETANADMASICQIGVASFRDGAVDREWTTLVDPEDEFDPINVMIHGIDEGRVKGAPTLAAIASRLEEQLADQICVCHTHFDRISIQRAFEKNALAHPNLTWLDSARVARRTWSQFARKGYGLGNICRFLGYRYQEHDALEDAKAAGEVILAALRESQTGIHEWLERVDFPIGFDAADRSRNESRQGDPSGDLHGEVVVFTGALSIPRDDAADMAASAGCRVAVRVSGKTTILVVGDQDIRVLAGHTKSRKHRDAEEKIRKGQAIRILKESDFRRLVESSD